jgi:hypothetical protein
MILELDIGSSKFVDNRAGLKWLIFWIFCKIQSSSFTWVSILLFHNWLPRKKRTGDVLHCCSPIDQQNSTSTRTLGWTWQNGALINNQQESLLFFNDYMSFLFWDLLSSLLDGWPCQNIVGQWIWKGFDTCTKEGGAKKKLYRVWKFIVW